ncbi:hypothetical protein HGRIS_009655 [Hohenbuehelia grisea]|uniref:Uncharacterized protein n=1 Tax=Hohenbuehelia grisea TaxID=104357 RepID=A0ABR3J1T8_9AGAR
MNRFTEDTQPNEKRLIPKGATVPSIRPTGSRNVWGGRPSVHPYKPRRNLISAKSAAFPPTASDREFRQLDLHSKAGPSSPGSSFKNRSRSSDGTLQSQPTRQRGRRDRNRGNTCEVVVELPNECRKGIPGCHERRRNWIARQIEDIHRQQNLQVYNHELLPTTVRFFCRRSDAPICTPEISTIDAHGSRSTMEYEDDDEVYRLLVEEKNISSNEEVLLSTVQTELSDTSYAEVSPPIRSKSSLCHATPPAISVTNELFTPHNSNSTGIPVQCTPPPPMPAVRLPTPMVPRFRSGRLSMQPVQRALPQTSKPLGVTDLSRDNGFRSLPVQDQSRAEHLPVSAQGALECRMEDLDNQVIILEAESRRQISADQLEKSRCLAFHPDDSAVYITSSRGAVDSIQGGSFESHQISSSYVSSSTVDDACILSTYPNTAMVHAHSGEHAQVTLVTVQNDHKMARVPLLRPLSNDKKAGVSAIVNMSQPLTFASGGHDHVVHLWDVKPDFSGATARHLPIKHNSVVQCLTPVKDTSHKLISCGADCLVNIYDLSSERVVNTMRTSNSVYRAHTLAPPFCTLLEVAHRELQFEIRDHRLVPELPVQRFGYNTATLHGRFIRGDVDGHLFASGSQDGFVRLWDLRNLKAPPIKFLSKQGKKITHVAFGLSRLFALGAEQYVDIIKYSTQI